MQTHQVDPSAQVQAELRPHIHLVSSFKCESRGDPFNLSKEQIVELLKAAAVETKSNNESWSWKMLEAPRDRTAFMIWQSPHQVQGRNFPSDGYVWADPEKPSDEIVHGFKLESFCHESGYVPSYEQFTLHSRTRYRLTPAGPNGPSQGCDPYLWLVLYQRAARNRIISIRNINPLNIQQQKPSMEQRRMILYNGTPKSKEFVWEDRSHWPEIRLPSFNGPARQQAPNYIARSQQMPFMGGQQLIDPRTGQPSAKRLKQAPIVPAYNFPEGEDDGGNGDIMDILTPRDISRMRYRQHAEWMEELYASPFSVVQLMPVSVGLGRRGELAALSKDIKSIDTPLDADDSVPAQKITSQDYETYIQNAKDKMAELRADMEKDKLIHKRRLAKLQKASGIQDAEQKLRGTNQMPSIPSQGSNTPQGDKEGSNSMANRRDMDATSSRQVDEIQAITRSVEEKMNRQVEPVATSMVIDRGGLEERAPTPIDQAPVDAQSDHDEGRMDDLLDASGQGNLNGSNAPSSHHGMAASADAGAGDSQRSGSGGGAGNGGGDEDYVMVDKDLGEVDHESPAEAPLEPGQDAGDAMDGEDFLNFESDGNVDNFDSMFTDTLDAGTGLEGADDGAMDALTAGLDGEEPAANRNAVDSLTEPGNL